MLKNVKSKSIEISKKFTGNYFNYQNSLKNTRGNDEKTDLIINQTKVPFKIDGIIKLIPELENILTNDLMKSIYFYEESSILIK